VRIFYLGVAAAIQLVAYGNARPAHGQNVLTPDQFRDQLMTCATQQKIVSGPDLIKTIGDIYTDQVLRSSLRDSSVFLALVPEKDRLAAYRLYVQCITPVLPQDLRSQSLSTITYKVCTGEIESNCRPHDKYLYCYSDAAAWAKSICTSFTIQRVETYGGNKCGYSLDVVVCTGPR
jgi:hypothetical protein